MGMEVVALQTSTLRLAVAAAGHRTCLCRVAGSSRGMLTCSCCTCQRQLGAAPLQICCPASCSSIKRANLQLLPILEGNLELICRGLLADRQKGDSCILLPGWQCENYKIFCGCSTGQAEAPSQVLGTIVRDQPEQLRIPGGPAACESWCCTECQIASAALSNKGSHAKPVEASLTAMERGETEEPMW